MMKKITAAVLMVVALLAIFFAFMILMDPVLAFLHSSVLKPIAKPFVDYGSKPIFEFMLEIFPKSFWEIPYFGILVFVLSGVLPVVILAIVFKIFLFSVKRNETKIFKRKALMYCGYCGEKLIDNEKFCAGCGEKIKVKSSKNVDRQSLIKEVDRVFVYKFIYPIVIIYSIIPSFSKDEFDKFDYLASLFAGFINIAILHFIIFYLWGRLKNMLLLTLAIGLNMLVVIMHVIGTNFDLDPSTQLVVSAIGLEFEDSDSLRLVSIFDYLSFALLIVEIGCLLYLRKRFLQKNEDRSKG